ncbi:MAG: hypothetical protein IKU29_04440 [Parabacteroides sp.]|nr:hypothetical protein [Parabacteroides sp.]
MNKLSFIIIAILLGLVGLLTNRLSNKNDELQNAIQNYKASSDTLSQIRLENNQLLYEKNAYILKESEMIEQLELNKSEIKGLQKELNSKIALLNSIQGKVKVDTIITRDTMYMVDSIRYIDFTYNDKWLKLVGSTAIDPHPSTTISSIEIPLSIQTGITESNVIFVKTDNPYIKITSMEGAVVSRKKIELKHGIFVGAGFQYGLFNGRMDFGPQIGYGLQIKF